LTPPRAAPLDKINKKSREVAGLEKRGEILGEKIIGSQFLLPQLAETTRLYPTICRLNGP